MSCGLGRVAVNVAVGDFRLWLQLAAVVMVVILEKKKQVLGTQQHEGWSLMCIVFERPRFICPRLVVQARAQ